MRDNREVSRKVPSFHRSGLLLLASLTACAGEIDAGDQPETDPPDDVEACGDPGYGDGTCDADLACAAPDIDCYTVFPDHVAAVDWFQEIEAQGAEQEGRAPRAVLPASDPRFVRARRLLDRTWEAYQEIFSVGDLADYGPELLLIEDAGPNAFVQGDGLGKVAFAVVVQTGALDLQPLDEPLMGTMAHELTHALYLHIIGDVRLGVRRYYASAGEEPLGYQQPDDATVRGHVEEWQSLAGEVGQFSQQSLLGMPLSAGQDEISWVFQKGLARLAPENPEGCAAPLEYFDQATSDIFTLYRQIDQTLVTTGYEDQIAAVANAAMARLRDECLPGLPYDAIDVFALVTGQSLEDARKQLDPADIALVDGKHFIDGVWALVKDRRARMRDIEARFAVDTGRSWTAARYYSVEEEADDGTVAVLEQAGVDLDAQGQSLFSKLGGDDVQQACIDAMAAGDAPYGADLSDEHHATCWRVDHIDQLVAAGGVRQTRASQAARVLARPPAQARRPLRLKPSLPPVLY